MTSFLLHVFDQFKMLAKKACIQFSFTGMQVYLVCSTICNPTYSTSSVKEFTNDLIECWQYINALCQGSEAVQKSTAQNPSTNETEYLCSVLNPTRV